MEVIGREEFEQAMVALGMTKICDKCHVQYVYSCPECYCPEQEPTWQKEEPHAPTR